MRIRSKIFVIFFITSLLPIIFLTYINLNFSQNALVKDTESELETIADLQTANIHTIINAYKNRINFLAARPTVLSQVTTFNNTKDNTQIKNTLNSILLSLPDVQIVSLIDLQGNVVVSTDDSVIGKKQFISQLPVIKVTKDTPSIDFLPDNDGNLKIRFRKTLYDKTTKLGELEFITEENIFNKVTNNYIGLKKTGEVDLAIKDNAGKIFFITPTRFKKTAGYIPSTFANTTPSAEALKKSNTFIPETSDYRGKAVSAVTRYLSDLDMGLVVKIDRDEAFQPINELRDSMLIFSFIFILFVVMVVLFFVHSLTGPIINLLFAAKGVYTGDLSKRALVLSKDEIGELSASFNTMLDALQASHEDLEKKVEERTKQLETSNKDLEAFSYSVSHDLRAPLRSIDGFSQILEEDYTPKLDDEGKRVIATIRASTKQMATLIDDLLTFSRLGRKPIEAQDVNMTSLAKTVFDELKLANPTRVIQFDCAELPHAHGDAALLKQVWVNLLSNAIKYTKKKETAIITVASTSDNNNNIYCVKDNGAGFDMQYKDKLFGVFQRLHSAQEFEGTGVGLAIVSRIITKHGGSVRAEGVVDQGATFSFSLPKT